MNTQMVRTTVYLPVDLVEEAKRRALEKKKSLSGLVEEGLRGRLKLAPKKNKSLRLGSYKLGGAKFSRKELYEEVLRHRVRGY